MNGSQITAYIGLGSNIGIREENLNQAIELLRQADNIEVMAVSSYFNTAPVGYTQQPDFLNAAVELKTSLSPDGLLDVCRQIETALKRERSIRWGPRTIDLDILLYGNLIVNCLHLVIPHPRMHEREFVLKPLNEISPLSVHPVLKQTIGSLYRNLQQYSVREIETSKSAIDLFELIHTLPYSVLLDSSFTQDETGRYSIIAFEPFKVLVTKGTHIEITSGKSRESYEGSPFEAMKKLLGMYKLQSHPYLPFISGCIGFFSYDLGRLIEDIPDIAEEDIEVPDIVLGFYNNAILIDHVENRTYIAVSSMGMPEHPDNSSRLEERYAQIMDIISRDKAVPKEARTQQNISEQRNTAVVSNFTKEEYCRMIVRAREYIRNGDIFQVNLSQRFESIINSTPFTLYKSLRMRNPAQFSACMDFGGIQILSSSPEKFIKIEGRTIEIRPIKGTCRRGKTPEEDRLLMDELFHSEKDRAENIMIVDLERNDLGRVCKIGTVHVDRLLDVETYSTVHHLVSIVKGELHDHVDVTDCIKAAFPGGSITGAPKIRAMEIIEELEPVKRGIYTGSLGYIGFDGRCDLNIVIRTILVKNGAAYYHVGGGIVWDSVPEKEYQETLDKGQALMQLLNEGV